MRFSLIFVAATVCALALFGGPSQVAHGATFTVTKTADTNDGVCDADCSLREAIDDANFWSGLDTIDFSGLGAGTHTITLGSALPSITDPVLIDGTTAVSYAGAPVIVLNGTGLPAGTDGLKFVGALGEVRALAIVSFPGDGVELGGFGITVTRSYIGMDPDGTTVRGNGGNGINIPGLGSNTVGGLGVGNLISGNGANGVLITGESADSNSVKYNTIGLDISATVKKGNGGSGVRIDGGADSNVIGAAGEGNTISGNTLDGVAISGSTTTLNTVAYGLIGTNIAYAAGLGNGVQGVRIDDAPSNTVRFSAISGNLLGVAIIGSGATGNLVEDNAIGTDATGDTALPNVIGVYIDEAPSNTIRHNVISGNSAAGVEIVGGGATGNLVEDNAVGTNVAGDTALSNANGVRVRSGASFNTVGPDNLISGNGNTGVVITSSANTNTVTDNKIGTNLAGTAAIPNGTVGVWIFEAYSNIVGPDNLISGNSWHGVEIEVGTGNTVTGNSIYSNGGLGISNILGGNSELTPPTVTAAGSASGSSDCAVCTIEVFSDASDEGETSHGFATTDAGPCPCAWSYPDAVTGPNITATVTDGSGNTSEFSVPFVADTDGDGQLDSVDACPALATPWKTLAGDDDCDGQVTGDAFSGETFIGTDPTDACADTTTWYDERGPAFGEELSPWPPDVNDSGNVTLSDFLAFAPTFLKFDPDPAYNKRFDFNASGGVTLSDALSLGQYWLKFCDDYFNPLP